jgi:hypothetical protein
MDSEGEPFVRFTADDDEWPGSYGGARLGIP